MCIVHYIWQVWTSLATFTAYRTNRANQAITDCTESGVEIFENALISDKKIEAEGSICKILGKFLHF